MTKVNRFLLWIAAALLVIVVAANEAVWLHAFGFMGSRLGLWGSFRLDNAELRMRSGWYAIQKASDYKGPGIPSSALLAFKSEWPKFGARNQIGITKLAAEDAAKLAAPGSHIQKMEKFPWGNAIFLRTGNSVFIPEAQILVASGTGYEGRLGEAIQDIEAITVTNPR